MSSGIEPFTGERGASSGVSRSEAPPPQAPAAAAEPRGDALNDGARPAHAAGSSRRFAAHRAAAPKRLARFWRPAAPPPGIYHRDTFGRRVALTFDDGPDPVQTPNVLEILAHFAVEATFFVNGARVRDHPELVRRIVASGHALGNHSWSHPQLTKLSRAGIDQQLADTRRAVDDALGYRYELALVRPPYGAVNARVRAAIREAGDYLIMWNVDSNDWRHGDDRAAILRNVFQGAASVYGGGGVILFHDVLPQTAAVLPQVLERLRADGFDIWSVELLLDEKYPPPRQSPPAKPTREV